MSRSYNKWFLTSCGNLRQYNPVDKFIQLEKYSSIAQSVGRMLWNYNKLFLTSSGNFRHQNPVDKFIQLEKYSSIAQSVEHAAVNRGVVGSSPTGGARIPHTRTVACCIWQRVCRVCGTDRQRPLLMQRFLLCFLPFV